MRGGGGREEGYPGSSCLDYAFNYHKPILFHILYPIAHSYATSGFLPTSKLIPFLTSPPTVLLVIVPSALPK